jgi:formate C-acetyltransferase
LHEELDAYYRQYRGWNPATYPPASRAVRQSILAAMDAYADAHPHEHPSLLKARLHEEIAERFEPVVFRHSPFPYEMGLRFAENWGNPGGAETTVGAWLLRRKQSLLADRPEWQWLKAFKLLDSTDGLGIWNVWSWFDVDHHCIGYTGLFRAGVNGRLAAIAARRAEACDADQAAQLDAMARSSRAVLRVAARFAAEARRLLAAETDPDARRCLALAADALDRVPAEPPRTFLEGLAMLWFLREVTATMESIGISVVGHVDRLLGDLYPADVAAGRLTEADARDWLARWMLPTDVKFHVGDNAWPETSTCIELGGCDAEARPVWNEVTRLVIETHRAHGLLNPKLNCRYGATSPQAYLDLIGAAILAGHNHFALLNDDVLIPACVRAGKKPEEARLYVNGGCQETIVEGVEHSAGAYFYFCLPRVLDLCLQSPDRLPALSPEAAAALPAVVESAPTFEAFLAHVTASLRNAIRLGTRWVTTLGREHGRVHPCPFFSATLEGCTETARDYTAGGARYNPSGLCLVGLGTLVDSLHAVRVAVYEERWLTLSDLRRHLVANWASAEDLRQRLRRLPKFGHGDARVDTLAAELARDLAVFARGLPSERGGFFQASFFVYYAFQWFARAVRATPDGRRAGDLLTQGVAPDRTNPPRSLTDTFRSLSAIDFVDMPANSVLDVQIPLARDMTPATLTAVARAFARLGGPTLQPNLVSIETLRDARLHPERHRDLVVRICGLSAYFVSLTPEVQDEIVSRAVSGV